MRIAFISRVVFLGGVTTHMIDLSREFIKQGHEVYLLSYGPRYKDSKENIAIFEKLISTGINFIEVDFPIDKSSKIKYGINLLSTINQCKKIFETYNFDAIHVHTPILSFIPKLLGYKFIRTRHILDSSYPFFDIKANYEIAISQEIRKCLIDRYKYNNNEIFLINNGVCKEEYFIDSAERHEIKAKENKLKLKKNSIVIGLVGTFEYRKGHDILLNAVSLLNQTQLEKIELLFIGSSDQDNLLRVKELINKFNLTNKVQILPFQNLRNIYSLIDILVLPSRREGFPLVSIEGMMMQCCVVRSNTEGSYEQIIPNESGLIFENENVNQLHSLLSELIDNPKEIERLAIGGQKRALEYFTSDQMASKTLQVYQKLASDPNK